MVVFMNAIVDQSNAIFRCERLQWLWVWEYWNLKHKLAFKVRMIYKDCDCLNLNIFEKCIPKNYIKNEAWHFLPFLIISLRVFLTRSTHLEMSITLSLKIMLKFTFITNKSNSYSASNRASKSITSHQVIGAELFLLLCSSIFAVKDFLCAEKIKVGLTPVLAPFSNPTNSLLVRTLSLDSSTSLSYS